MSNTFISKECEQNFIGGLEKLQSKIVDISKFAHLKFFSVLIQILLLLFYSMSELAHDSHQLNPPAPSASPPVWPDP